MRLRGLRHPAPEEMYLEVVLSFICSYLNMLFVDNLQWWWERAAFRSNSQDRFASGLSCIDNLCQWQVIAVSFELPVDAPPGAPAPGAWGDVIESKYLIAYKIECCYTIPPRCPCPGHETGPRRFIKLWEACRKGKTIHFLVSNQLWIQLWVLHAETQHFLKYFRTCWKTLKVNILLKSNIF